MNIAIERLAEVLSKQFSKNEVFGLAKVLSVAQDRETISYQEIDIPSGLKDELLLALHQERILISISNSSKGSSVWEDKILRLDPQEKYQMPRA